MNEQIEKYCIMAEDRDSGKRTPIARNLSKKDADAWTATAFEKKYYRYFRVAKQK